MPDSSPNLPELKSFLEGLPEPHILFGSDYRILAANAAYRRQFGTEASVLGRTCYAVSHHFDHPCDQSGESCPLRQARESGQPERVLHLHHTPQGETYVNIELLPLRDQHGELRYFIEKMQSLPTASAGHSAQALSGRSPEFQRMLTLVARVGPSDASVLLTGETGTGKELVAQAVHAASRRARAPFVVVDCASLAESLFESELFGHERGAFTGANATKPGLVEAANGGTLFLDEVGDIPAAIQVKLLRLLESGTFRRVGGTDIRHTDVRLVSATHRHLPQRVAEGLFRQDLYFRLAVFPVHLPALRERKGDVPVLAQALLARLDPSGHLSLAPAALERLSAHPYPGNIRELRNVLERCTVLCDGAVIEASHVAQALALGQAPASSGRHPANPPLTAHNTTHWAAHSATHNATHNTNHAAATVPPTPDAALPATLPAARPAITEPLVVPNARRGSPPADLRTRLAALGGSRSALAAQLGVSERTVYRWLGRHEVAGPQNS